MVKELVGLRKLIADCYPNIQILDVAKESGQRVVYYCRFYEDASPFSSWHQWGDVVLKVSAGLSPASYTYLQREIEFLKNSRSPYFPRLHHFSILSENPVTEEHLDPKLFVTIEERIDAVPLSTKLNEYKSEMDVANLLLKLIRALKLLWTHEKTFVHRDLKPDNILVRPSGEVVIIDLGIVREAGADGVTATLLPYGPMTYWYASPEQAVNDKRNISFKSDIFSLGVITYELVTGKNPFATGSPVTVDELLSRIVHYIPPALHSIGNCSQEFSMVVVKMLEKEPYKRYRTIGQLENELLVLTQRQIRSGK